MIDTLGITRTVFLFLQKQVFEILYKIVDIPFLSAYKLKILVSHQTCLSFLSAYG